MPILYSAYHSWVFFHAQPGTRCVKRVSYIIAKLTNHLNYLFDNREFGKERGRVETRRDYQRCRKQQQLERELAGYFDWICAAEDAILNEETTTDEERAAIMESMASSRYEILK